MVKKPAKKLGPKGPRNRPNDPKRIQRIVRLRDKSGLTFKEISERLGDDPPRTAMAILASYWRWRDWVYAG